MFDAGMGSTNVKATIAEVQRAVAALRGVTVEDLKSPCRKQPLTWFRQEAMAMARDVTGASLPQIARAFGDRDHTTALYAVRKIARARLSDPLLAADHERLRAQIMAEATIRHAREAELRQTVPETPEPPRRHFEGKLGGRWWSAADVSRLKSMRAMGLPREQVAEGLGRTLRAVEAKVKKLQLPHMHQRGRDVTEWMAEGVG